MNPYCSPLNVGNPPVHLVESELGVRQCGPGRRGQPQAQERLIRQDVGLLLAEPQADDLDGRSVRGGPLEQDRGGRLAGDQAVRVGRRLKPRARSSHHKELALM